MRLRSNLSGKEVAERMLRDHGIHDVKIISTPGQLTDHYNPVTKTVNLSEVVYNQRNAAAAAVAAHEVGHAVQHANAYSFLTMRSKLVPAVQFASGFMHWILLAGIFTINIFPSILIVGIGLFALTTLFSFVTLPVEFDASRRALNWISDRGVVTGDEYDAAQDALKWAAMTYVVAALSSLATLVYYVMIFLNSRD